MLDEAVLDQVMLDQGCQSLPAARHDGVAGARHVVGGGTVGRSQPSDASTAIAWFDDCTAAMR
ncbi:MAG: hypothetical protein H0T89_20880 [Deltaproteobacteria bacterium]|nr:hypothetical protein [Deltaproteobacteria bacterium]MDQ3301357.1 hypothetical protein [Myxococcota bacterium]